MTRPGFMLVMVTCLVLMAARVGRPQDTFVPSAFCGKAYSLLTSLT